MDQKAEKSFIISNEAWYCQQPELKLPEDEIIIGQYYNDNGCKAEMTVRWRDIKNTNYFGKDNVVIPRLEVYQDAWVNLKEMPELIDKLEELSHYQITPKILANELTELGYKDRTERILKL